MSLQVYRKVFLIVSVIATNTLALAFNQPGHQIVSDIAWQESTTATRQAALAILEHLPGKDQLLSGLPPEMDVEGQKRYLFDIASTWPDFVRSGKYQPYHRSIWHYITHPLLAAGETTTSFVPPQPLNGAANSIEALRLNMSIVQTTTSAEDRAVALAWVMHLVGDIHQPLHNVSLFSSDYPEGDRGGNSFTVRQFQESKPLALHKVWDDIFGDHLRFSNVLELANNFHARPEFSRAALATDLATTEPLQWAKEGAAIARSHVYLMDTTQPLQGARWDQVSSGTATAPVLPVGYMKNSRDFMRKRAVLGGYRLATVLDHILDPNRYPKVN